MPKFDNALRQVFAHRAKALAEFVLGVPVDGATSFGETELPGETMRADLVIAIAGPPQRTIHIELQIRAKATDIENRLVHYFLRLLQTYSVAPEQYVIVLDPKGGRLSGMYERGNLSLRYYPIHLWDIPAETLLSHPEFFVLAVLGESADRPGVLGQVLSRLDDSAIPEPMVDVAATLAGIHLPEHTISELFRRTHMPIDFRDIPLIRQITDEEAAKEAPKLAIPIAQKLAVTMAEKLAGPMAEQLAGPMAEQLAGPMAEQLAGPMAGQMAGQMAVKLAQRRFAPLSDNDNETLATSVAQAIGQAKVTPTQLQDMVLDAPDLATLQSQLAALTDA